MPYIILGSSVVFATIFALCYKWAARLGCELRAVNLWLYIGSTAVLLIYFLASGPRLSIGAASLGAATGVSVYVATMTFFYHIRTGRLAVSWTVIGLSVSIPILASIIIWHEQPTIKQWVGLALIPIALILFGQGRSRTAK